jgi:flagellar biosynthetic protein FliQ
MNPQDIIDLMHRALILAFLLAAPSLFFALAVGLVFSIFQAVTSIQEQSLVFVPKMMAVMLSLLILMGWMVRLCITFTEQIFMQIGRLTP